MRLLETIEAAAAAFGIVASSAVPSAGAASNAVPFTFDSSGIKIVAYHYAPSSRGQIAPVVILAHGLGLVQTSKIQPFAERFAAAGYHAVTFDYRYWGESDGEPRNIVNIPSQQDDYRAAIKAVKSLAGVDSSRVVIWGTSFSGGHVLAVGSQTPELAGIISQVPHTDGPASVSALPPASIPPLVVAGIEDAGRAIINEPPLYIPTVNRTGELGALTQAGAYEGYLSIQPSSPPPGNVLAARLVLELPLYSPDTILGTNGVPTFVGVCTYDNITPPSTSRDVAQRIGADLHEYPGGHFDVYPGAPQYESIVADEIAFLKRQVPV